jgi:hypothetical protein
MSAEYGGAIVSPEAALMHRDWPEGQEPPEIRPRVAAKRKNRAERRIASGQLTAAERWERRKIMAGLHAKGRTLDQIGRQFNISGPRVSQEIAELVNEYRLGALKSIGEKIAAEEALLYMVQLEATDAWFESKRGKVTHNSKKVEEVKSGFVRGRMKGRGVLGGPVKKREVKAGANAAIESLFDDERPDDDSEALEQAQLEAMLNTPDLTKDEKYTRRESSPGDPRYLKIILECHDRRAKLHGLYERDDAGLGDEIRDLTPQQRIEALRNHIEKARQERAKQIALGTGGNPVPAHLMEATARPKSLRPMPAVTIVKPGGNGHKAHQPAPVVMEAEF